MENRKYDLKFDPDNYTEKTVEVEGTTVKYRAYENIVYVSRPVDLQFHSMSIYVPESAYGRKDVPVFIRNYVGGYMSTGIVEPDMNNPIPFLGRGLAYALYRGFVCVSPGTRGREDKVDGKYTGKAPRGLADLKAVVRYLRHNADTVPGNIKYIFSDGSSAGGAMSSLLGTTGNMPDYEPYLNEIGAADERDDIFAAFCFCPIIDIENANCAYEWMFGNVTDFSGMKPRVVDNELVFDPIDYHIDEDGQKLSGKFADLFVEYQNAMGLKDPENGEPLTLDKGSDSGTYYDYLLKKLSEGADEFLCKLPEEERTAYLSENPWLRSRNGKTVLEPAYFRDFIKHVSRGKICPTFDEFGLGSPENSLYGCDEEPKVHFDDALEEVSGNTGKYAVSGEVHKLTYLMNPMKHINEDKCTIAPNFYIRVGSLDSNHSYSAAMNLALALENSGRCRNVDFKIAWDVDHDGDYEMKEMFDWADNVCR